MLGKKDPQGRFFDHYVYERHLPRGHELVRIHKEVDFSFVETETRDLYEEEMGRPSWPPEVLFRMLFLEYYDNLSDVEVSEQCVYNLLYRWFVGLGVGEATPDDTTLVVFRKRLGRERMERLFSRVNEQVKGRYTEEADRVIEGLEGMLYGEEKVVSLVDPDARWGYKDEDHPCLRQTGLLWI